MSVDTFIGKAQARQESVMTDACTIEAGDVADPTYDPETGQIDYDPGASIYTGPCLVRPSTITSTGDRKAGEELVNVGQYTVKIPAAVDVPDGALVTITDSRHDAALIDTTMVVVSVTLDGWGVNRRLYCEDVNRGHGS